MDKLTLLDDMKLFDELRQISTSKNEINFMRQVFKASKGNTKPKMWLKILEKSREANILLRNRICCNKLMLGQKFYLENDHTEALSLVSSAINENPSDKEILHDLLFFRGAILCKNERYGLAATLMEFYVKERPDGFEKVLDCFIRGLVENGELEKARQYLGEYKESVIAMKRARKKNLELIKEHEEKIKALFELLVGLKQTASEERKEEDSLKPFDGYGSLCKQIYLNKKKSKMGDVRIVATKDIERGQILFYEHPLAIHFTKKGFQCDFCWTKALVTPCFSCAGVFYCSKRCQEQHWTEMHQYECRGMHNHLLQAIKGVLLFRSLIEFLKCLKSELMDEGIAYKADELWKLLLELPKDHSFSFQMFQNPLYDRLGFWEIRSVLTKTLCITAYIMDHPSILSDFFPASIKIEAKREIEVFLSALLLRLAAQINARGVFMQYKLDNDNTDTLTRFDRDWEVAQDQLHGCKANLKDEENPFSCTMNQILQEREEKSDEECLNDFGVSASGISYQMDSFKGRFTQSNFGLYAKLPRFAHSCDPNTFFILKSGGLIVVYAARDIIAGSEITVSWGPHYKLHRREERQEMLPAHLRDCSCQCCTSDKDFLDTVRTIRCTKCSHPIDYDATKCPSCACESELINGTHLEHILVMCDRMSVIFNYVSEPPDSVKVAEHYDFINKHLDLARRIVHEHSDFLYRLRTAKVMVLAHMKDVKRAYAVLGELRATIDATLVDMSYEKFTELMKIYEIGRVFLWFMNETQPYPLLDAIDMHRFLKQLIREARLIYKLHAWSDEEHETLEKEWMWLQNQGELMIEERRLVTDEAKELVPGMKVGEWLGMMIDKCEKEVLAHNRNSLMLSKEAFGKNTTAKGRDEGI